MCLTLPHIRDEITARGCLQFARVSSGFPVLIHGSAQIVVEKSSFRNSAGALPHNTLPSGCRCHYGIFDKLIRIYKKFGVPQSEFFGYWKHPAEVIRGKDIFVSVYKQPGGRKALAVISHIGKGHEKQSVEIDFDARKLGMAPFSKALDCMTAPDPDYAWLEEQRRKERVPPTRAPLKLGDFGSSIQSCSNGKLKMTLDFHSFAIVELE